MVSFARPIERRFATGRAGEPIAVRVHGGYDPDVIYAAAGKPVLITFRREETAPCSERVLFPAFGRSTMLPPYSEVTVELPRAEPGGYEFVLLGHWFEMRARGGANDAIRALLDLAPPRAVVIREGQELEVATAEVEVGDLLLMRPGGEGARRRRGARGRELGRRVDGHR